ncbi:hypothetical protein WJU23_10645 [Prosthecobacter sp. SYSU 5D2]|uniref:hypothetical protein n=1 Tax=Prosthecobacter sp. SYSU 5D2 TaxID=3134134 RepID=UPI0031FECAAF
MNATLMINSFTPEEQKELLHALVDRLFPEAESNEEEDAFPEWLLKDLKEQNQRYHAGLETGDDLDVVEARLKAKFQSR